MFEITSIETLKTNHDLPTNLPGQAILNDTDRYYPTLWIMAIVKLIDFELEMMYPPHISLATIAVQLRIDEVEKLKQDKPVFSFCGIYVNHKSWFQVVCLCLIAVLMIEFLYF